jgi:hypothetical protein
MTHLAATAHQAELRRMADRPHHRIERSGVASPSSRRSIRAALRRLRRSLGAARSTSAGPVAS